MVVELNLRPLFLSGWDQSPSQNPVGHPAPTMNYLINITKTFQSLREFQLPGKMWYKYIFKNYAIPHKFDENYKPQYSTYWGIPSRLSIKKTTPRHKRLRMLKTSDKEKLKSIQRKITHTFRYAKNHWLLVWNWARKKDNGTTWHL